MICIKEKKNRRENLIIYKKINMSIDEKAYEKLRRYKNLCMQKYAREFEEFDLLNYAPEDRACARWKYIDYKLNTNENYILLRKQVHIKRNSFI